MLIDAFSDRETVENALEELGAVVIWPAGAPDRTKRVELADCDVDDSEAAEMLPSHYFEFDEEWERPDDRDVSDFVAALLRADREGALALAHRVFADNRNRDVVERLLQPLRRVA